MEFLKSATAEVVVDIVVFVLAFTLYTGANAKKMVGCGIKQGITSVSSSSDATAHSSAEKAGPLKAP